MSDFQGTEVGEVHFENLKIGTRSFEMRKKAEVKRTVVVKNEFFEACPLTCEEGPQCLRVKRLAVENSQAEKILGQRRE